MLLFLFRKRAKSVVLIPQRKVIIVQFQHLSFNRVEEFGYPGDTKWCVKLLEYFHQTDREVKLADITRWIDRHSWIKVLLFIIIRILLNYFCSLYNHIYLSLSPF